MPHPPWAIRQAAAARCVPGAGWLSLALLIGVAGCQTPSDHPAVSAESPQLLYAQHCLGCHGATGEGLYGPNIQGLNRSIDQIVDVIASGRGKMPSFTGDLSKARMRQIAQYVKTFKYKP